MAMVEVLYSLLVTGAGLLASGAATEFAKGAGKVAFDALKARLISTHGAASMVLVEQAKGNPAYEAAIKADLAPPDIAKDTEVTRLAGELRAAIKALPVAVKAPYAVDIGVIESGGDLLFENVEGVRSDQVTSRQDMTFRNIKAPPGK
jgi:hypothetical protein